MSTFFRRIFCLKSNKNISTDSNNNMSVDDDIKERKILDLQKQFQLPRDLIITVLKENNWILEECLIPLDTIKRNSEKLDIMQSNVNALRENILSSFNIEVINI